MKITPRSLALFPLALFLALAGSALASAGFQFTNSGLITINDNSTASPYPSSITVSGVSANVVTKVTVSLNGFSHTFPDDVDILLVGPQGQRSIIMSDAGGSPDAVNLNLLFDQASANILPDAGPLATGTYRPANYEAGADTFPAPGPGALSSEPADLSVFNLTNPNGTWSLYVVDDSRGDVGQITNGWTLTLTIPTVFTVINTNDSGVGSLRAALASAQDGDLINFSALFNTPQTINLLTVLPDIIKSVTIQGPGANLLTVRRDFNAATNFRVFNIPVGVANGVAISGMTVTGGNAGSGLFGGGINSQSNLTLTNVHVTGNQANDGGGVSVSFAAGVFTGCTFSGNTSSAQGGGIDYQGNGNTLRLLNSTVSGNTSNIGGGISNSSANSRVEITSSTIVNNIGGDGISTFESTGNTATTTLRNTIIAGNTPNNLSASGGGTVTTLGFNLSDNFNGVFTPAATDITTARPRLGPLSLNGGTTPTHALLGGSPAIDAGNNSGATTDQRGQPRRFDLPGVPNPIGGDGADIGAVEMRPILNVTNSSDTGLGSLRQAISDANGNADLTDILFDSTLFSTPQTINLLSALPNITQSATINGPGANLLTVRRDYNAATDFTVFNIAGGVTNGVAISGMTISNGRDVGGAGQDGFGGGIDSNSNLTLTNVHVTGNQASTGGGVSLGFASGVFTGCTFSGNNAAQGGGIDYEGTGNTLRLVNSTVSGNTSIINGGIYNLNSRVEIMSSTLANNTGGGISTITQGAGTTATTTLRNTIIAGNSPNNLATGTNGGGAATFQTLGFNLSNDYTGGGFTPASNDITAQPRLAPLALYGGQTPTHALLGDSPAIDAGNSSGFLTDQRGRTRPFDTPNVANASDGADIGAAETQTVFVTNTQSSGAGSLPLVVTNAPANSDILFFASVFNVPRTIVLTGGELGITKNLNIIGPGANLLTVSGNNNSRVFSINSGFTASLSGMTITGGNGAGAINSGFGGGIYSNGDLALTNLYLTSNHASASGGGVQLGFANGFITGCTFSANTASSDGGGINYEGDGGHALRLVSSTVSGNSASNNSGGILNISFSGSSQLDVVNSTIANNTPGSGINTYAANSGNSATTTLRNTIIAGNAPSNLIAGGSGTPKVTTFGFNLTSDNGGGFLNVAPINSDRVSANAALAPLAFNGGTTPTHALLAGSEALDAGHDSGVLTDQRGLGFTRTIDLPQITNATRSDGTDIGAVEALIDPALRITSITRQANGQVVLTGVGTSFATYTIERSATTPDSASFGTLNTVAADAAGVIRYTDSPATNLSRVFYRLR